MRERREVSGLALAREDRQRDVVEGGQIVEQVHELEAARDAGAHALGDRGMGHVRALEDDLARVLAQMRADHVAQRGLAGAVRPDQRDELALLDAQRHVVDGARLAEIFLQVDRLQEAHGVLRSDLVGEPRNGADDAGREHHHEDDKHDAEQELPVFGARDRIGLEIVEHTAPTIGPVKLRKPPSTVMNTSSPENGQ